jgi:hypothetical protein
MYKIAICGRANTGKNTLAKLLEQEIYDKTNREWAIKSDTPPEQTYTNFSWKSMAWADPIKEIVLLMFPHASKECLYGSSHLRSEPIPGAFKNDKPLTYRQALIDIGTEVGRAYNDKIWLENFDHRYEQLLLKGKPDLVVVTDTRFRNEFEHLKKKGFFQIRLYRDTGKLSEINHISETNQNTILDEEFDYVLFNNKSLDELREEIKCNIIPRLKR